MVTQNVLPFKNPTGEKCAKKDIPENCRNFPEKKN
jgi:hypothetical protein